jgi:hypothetical protein
VAESASASPPLPPILGLGVADRLPLHIRNDDGTVLVSPELSAAARTTLGVDSVPRLPNLRDAHRANLAAHRARFFGVSNKSC